MKKIFLLAIIASMMFSCRFSDKRSKPASLGGTCDIVVVMKSTKWNSWIGDSIKAYLQAESPALPQSEAMFKCGQFEPGELSDLMSKSRNILQVNISDTVKKEGLFMREDVFAEPQTILDLNAKTDTSCLKILKTRYQNIADLFHKTERERFINTFKQNNNIEVASKVEQILGFSVVIPPSYFLAKSGSDYAWVRLEHSRYSQALLFYRRDYTDSSDFNATRIIAYRNKIARENIPGSLPDSYMATDTIMPWSVRNIPFGENRAIEIRGLWCVINDYMGGPFVNYTFLSPDKKKIITAEGYVYYPNNPKRDLLLQLESILYSISYKK